MIVHAAIPSPPISTLSLGPLTVRIYGLCILAGIFTALIIAMRRYRERGGNADYVVDAALLAVPAGIIGGRIYHVVTSYQYYVGPGRNLADAVKIWHGGLGIWGAVALGALGAFVIVRYRRQRFAPFADALAPGLLCAQAVGRLGNWFNQELFGAPTALPWGLSIDDAHLPAGYASGTLFHPTFLYEMIWNLALAAVLVWWDRRRRPSAGVVWWLYVAGYCAGRVWIEYLRIDEANLIFGVRLNVWTSLVGIVVALVFCWLAARRGGRHDVDPEELDPATAKTST
ncbi:MAG: prolipoprotein diacylglyceryl transferase [Actinomycetaceae bacterium]|nr:prolipoprotein diacylglyceryl transferase [Actinomycetaceae bacterium]